MELFDDTIEALNILHGLKYRLLVVTNQTVVSRGLISENDLQRIHLKLQKMVINLGGPKLEKFYYCPHHPEATIRNYRKVCKCRKPKDEMLRQAASEFEIALDESYMFGDRLSDIIAGNKAGCKTILIKSGRHLDPPIIGVDEEDYAEKPNFSVDNFLEASNRVKFYE